MQVPAAARAATEEAAPTEAAAGGGGDGAAEEAMEVEVEVAVEKAEPAEEAGEAEEGGEERFLLQQMALRQYIEVLRQPALAGKVSLKPWKLTLRRNALCSDLLAAMSKVTILAVAILAICYTCYGQTYYGYDVQGAPSRRATFPRYALAASMANTNYAYNCEGARPR